LILYHITTLADWEAAQAAGSYQSDSLGAQGFIHCSTREQVLKVANRFYRGRHGLVLLAIDPTRLRPEVRYENLEGGAELFPHLYGPLNLDAVSGVHAFEPIVDGGFALPPGLD
jgi:uncharacterized protein (DUF952 family)